MEPYPRSTINQYKYRSSLFYFYFYFIIVVAVVVETTGAMGTDALDFFADVGSRVRAVSNEAQSRTFILQQVSVALQRGNAASVLGTIGDPFRLGIRVLGTYHYFY